jgi:hypothetical protein
MTQMSVLYDADSCLAIEPIGSSIGSMTLKSSPDRSVFLHFTDPCMALLRDLSLPKKE